MWAVAALLHLVGNQAVATSTATVLLGAGIAIALLFPSRPWAIVPLAVAELASAWLEAPVLGNHWLVTALVAAAALLVVGRRALKRLPLDGASTIADLAPVARLILLGFYAFAAFAKLNTDFFDPAVSCASFYFEESTGSLGLDGLRLGDAAWIVIVGTAAVELSIPVLLLWRRTRRLWVLVALVFHALLAVDLTHQFYDFSSMLAALFVLFLPLEFAGWVGERARRVQDWLVQRGSLVPRLLHLVAVVGAVVAAVLTREWQDTPEASRLIDAGYVLWWAFALATIAAVVAFLRTGQPVEAPRPFRVASPVLALVPLLVLLNGLTPYLEIKTGYGFNMYANLRTVDGETNHLLLPTTFPLTDEQDEVVRIIESDDPVLRDYAERGYGLTPRQLRAYLSDHPDVGLTYEQGEERVEVDRAADRPELVEPVPLWVEKLLLFRAVDLGDKERCVPAFGPAR